MVEFPRCAIPLFFAILLVLTDVNSFMHGGASIVCGHSRRAIAIRFSFLISDDREMTEDL